MHVHVNGTRLWFDVDGQVLEPDGPGMRERPTVVLVHGGPGTYDHSYLKPAFSTLAAHAQVVYVDLRGHGRSSWDDPGSWSFEACADDLHGLCETLGIAAPVVLGHSLGGAVALLYGARHPGHAAGLIISSGFARLDVDRIVASCRDLGGDEIADIAQRAYTNEPVTDDEWARVFALFGPNLPSDEELARRRQNLEIAEIGSDALTGFDVTAELRQIRSPTLVVVGALDPITPVATAREIVQGLPAGVGQLEVIEGAGHFPWKDAPARYSRSLLDFIVPVHEGHRANARPRSSRSEP